MEIYDKLQPRVNLFCKAGEWGDKKEDLVQEIAASLSGFINSPDSRLGMCIFCFSNLNICYYSNLGLRVTYTKSHGSFSLF